MVALYRLWFTLVLVVSLPAVMYAGCGESGESCPGWEPPEALPRLHVENRWIKDTHGRTVLLRGINAGSRAKMPPHLPWDAQSLGDDDLDEKMARFYDFPADWGMNVIRLTLFWEAVEPGRGQYNETYLDRVEQQLKAAAAREIYVFVDFHQDLFSRVLGGSGAPAWALPDPEIEPIPLDDPGWFMRYFMGDDNVDAAFDRFWANNDGVQDAYQAMVLHVVERVKDHPNLIGIDLMNEPAAGAQGKEDYGVWFAQALEPFYEGLGRAILQSAPELIVIVEPTSMEAGGSDLGAALSRPDVDPLIFAPHYYNRIQFIIGEYSGDITDIEEELGHWDETGAQFNTPVLLSEYGFRRTAGDPVTNPDEYFADHYDVMDELWMHGTVWNHEVTENFWNLEDCSMVDGDWTERPRFTDGIARPYPRYTSGEPVSFRYRAATHEITYRYRIADTGGAPTEIALPGRHYPQPPGVELTFGTYRYDAQRKALLVFDGVCEGGTPVGAEQSVKIEP